MRDLKVRQVNPRALNAARYNPRRITPRELEKLRRSIREYGFVEPVLVRRADKTIIGGHQRVKAAILEGKKTIPAIFLDINAASSAVFTLCHGSHNGWRSGSGMIDLLCGSQSDSRALCLTTDGLDNITRSPLS